MSVYSNDQYASTWGRISGFNLATEAGVSFSGGDWALPLSGLIDPRFRSYPARVVLTGDPETDLPKSQLIIDFGYRRLWDFAGIFWSTIYRTGRWKIEKATEATIVEDELVLTDPVEVLPWSDALPRIYDVGELPLEAENFLDGRPTERELTWYGRHMLFASPAAISSRYIRISLDNNLPAAGLLDLGYLFVGTLFAPSVNHAFGLQQGLRFRDLEQEAPSGAKSYERRTSPRTLSVPYRALDKDAAMRIFDMQKSAGPRDLVVYLPAAVEPKHLFREVFLSRFTRPAALDFFAARGLRRTTIDLEEAL